MLKHCGRVLNSAEEEKRLWTEIPIADFMECELHFDTNRKFGLPVKKVGDNFSYET